MPPIVHTHNPTIRIAYHTGFLGPRSWLLYSGRFIPVYSSVTTDTPLLLKTPLVSTCPVIFFRRIQIPLL